MPKAQARVIVSGMLAGNPGHGGAAWAVLQYLLGLMRLGFDSYLVEPISQEQLLPAGATLDTSTNAAYFLEVVRTFRLEDRCCLILPGTKQTVGLPYSEVQTLLKTASVLLNVSGMLQDDLIADIPCRIFLDLDPAFNQLWHATLGLDMHLANHNYFVTVGNAIGRPGCSIPTCGVQWFSTLQPVVMDRWPKADAILYDAFTSIGNWRSYGSIEHDGIFYGQKAHALRALIDIPMRTSEKLMLALSIHPDERRDLEALSRNGWLLLDPAQIVNSPQNYQRFISHSKAELGIAKSGYVASRSGWFSDRSACYLACGRPVVAQDTGFSAFLPCGDGLFAFDSRDDALSAIESINRQYAHHSSAARSIAAEYFDSNRVISKLFNKIGVSA